MNEPFVIYNEPVYDAYDLKTFSETPGFINKAIT
jgi:hypothetical protein